MKFNRITIIPLLLMVAFLTSCSGGGGGSSQNLQAVEFDSAASASSVAITKAALQYNETTAVSATFKNAAGQPVQGIAVNFATTLGTITPANGIALTDAQGVATVQLTVGSASGQGQVTASATIDNRQLTKTGLFSVNLPALNLSPVTLGLANLSYGGSTSVSVTVKDAAGATFTSQDVDVVFTSTQTALGKATISSPVRTVNGVATATYKATTATGSDTITASIAGSTVTANVSISPLAAGSITYVSSTPANIGLKGMGGFGYQETSTVVFRVLDTSGQPRANQQVDFALNTTVGGLSLSQNSGSTGPDGTVSTIVQAGTVATPVRITAVVRGSNPAISTQSDQLVISTGVPAQDSFSVSLGNLNPESFEYDGVTSSVTARLSDHFHNPVPDGTAVYFTTSGGSIQPSCTTLNGLCSVNWTSQNPRPSNARVVILAYAIGEEYFLDLNGNGLADATDTWNDTSEAFRDDNENGTRQATEMFIDFNGDGIFNVADGKYNGVLQGADYIGSARSKHVFSNSVIVMSSSNPIITNSCSPIAVAAGNSTTCTISVSDINGNTMPSGTKIEFSLSAVQSCGGPAGGSCEFAIINPTQAVVVPQNIGSGMDVDVIIANKSSAGALGKSNLTVKVTTPKGLITSLAYPIN